MTVAAAPGALRDPVFARYLTGRALSNAGSVVTYIALPVLTYRLTGSASLTAAVAACEAVPYLLLGLFSGALSDRWNRKRVMITADLFSLVVVATLPLAHLLGRVTVPHLLLVAFLNPAASVFFDGAAFGAVPMLVGRDRIAEANAWIWGIASACEIGLPSVVGLALAFTDPATLIALDAASFGASAALVGTIVALMYDASRQRSRLTLRQVGRDVREGLTYVVHHAGVRTMTLIGFLQCLGAGGFVALQVVWIDQRLSIGTSGLRFGLVFGGWAAGQLAASVALPRLLRRSSAARIALGALPVSAAAGLAVPLIGRWWLATVVLAVWGIAYTLVAINGISYRQEITPEHLLGRVNTAARMLSWGVGWSGGAAVAGLLVHGVGLVPTLCVLALTGPLAVAVAWTSPLRRYAGMADVEEISSATGPEIEPARR